MHSNELLNEYIIENVNEIKNEEDNTPNLLTVNKSEIPPDNESVDLFGSQYSSDEKLSPNKSFIKSEKNEFNGNHLTSSNNPHIDESLYLNFEMETKPFANFKDIDTSVVRPGISNESDSSVKKKKHKKKKSRHDNFYENNLEAIETEVAFDSLGSEVEIINGETQHKRKKSKHSKEVIESEISNEVFIVEKKEKKYRKSSLSLKDSITQPLESADHETSQISIDNLIELTNEYERLEKKSKQKRKLSYENQTQRNGEDVIMIDSNKHEKPPKKKKKRVDGNSALSDIVDITEIIDSNKTIKEESVLLQHSDEVPSESRKKHKKRKSKEKVESNSIPVITLH